MINLALKKRLERLIQKIDPPKPRNPLKVWVICAKDLEDAERQRKLIEAGQVKHEDGSPFSPDDQNFFIDEVFTPKIKADSIPTMIMPRPEEAKRSDTSIAAGPAPMDLIPEEESRLEAAIRELEQRKQELLAGEK